MRIPHEADQPYQHVVKQILDAGAMGIVLPQVRTAADIDPLVRAMRYPPQAGAEYPEPRGRRGWGPDGRAAGLEPGQRRVRPPGRRVAAQPGGELLAIVMIETRESVENIDEILQVPGLGGVLIGPSDLSLSLGVGTPAANPRAPEVEEAIETVGQAACGTTRSAASTPARTSTRGWPRASSCSRCVERYGGAGRELK